MTTTPYNINNLQQQYNSNYAQINKQLLNLPMLPTYHQQQRSINDIKDMLYQQEQYMANMIEVAHNVNASAAKQNIIDILENYKNQLSQQTNKYAHYSNILTQGKTITSQYDTNTYNNNTSQHHTIDINKGSYNNNTTSASTSTSTPTSLDSQRERLLGNRNLLEDTSDSLDRTQYALSETTQIGSDTHNTLLQQREQFLRQQEMLYDTNSFLDRSKKVMNRMKRRIVTNKLIQYAIILLQCVLLAVIIYIKYYS